MSERDEMGGRYEVDRIMRAGMLDAAFGVGTVPVDLAVGSPLREAIDGWLAGRHPRICPHYADPFWYVLLPQTGIRCQACTIETLMDVEPHQWCCAACREPLTEDASYVDQAVEDGTWFVARFCRPCYERSAS